MVVDDRKLIIGSANLNDRSMLGFRDSETAIVAEETHDNGRLRSVYFDGQRVVVGEAARRLRRSLMAEHLGVLTRFHDRTEEPSFDIALLDDPVCDAFYHGVWGKVADTNMDILDKVRTY